jgi:hypothetical protein
VCVLLFKATFNVYDTAAAGPSLGGGSLPTRFQLRSTVCAVHRLSLLVVPGGFSLHELYSLRIGDSVSTSPPSPSLTLDWVTD